MDNEKMFYSKNNIDKIKSVGGNVLYYGILIPLILITISIFIQQIKNPQKIPNILGRKLFIILEEDSGSNIKENDLIITKNINPNKLQIGDVIAFRNNMDTVSVHRIKDITYTEKLDSNNQKQKVKTFVMIAAENETDDLKFVIEYSVEGKVIKRYANIRRNFAISAKTFNSYIRNNYNFNNWTSCILCSKKT